MKGCNPLMYWDNARERMPDGSFGAHTSSEGVSGWYECWQARVADQLNDKNTPYSPFLDDLTWYFQTFCTGYRPGIHDGHCFTRPVNKPRLEAYEVARWLGICGDHPGGFFSVAPDNSTNWVIIDIDKNSIYHPSVSGEQALEPVLKAAKKCGLQREILFRSSWSQGFHILYPLSQPVRSKKTAKIIRDAFLREELLIRDGVLEIFPNEAQTNLFKVIRAPLSGNGNAFWIDGLEMWCDDLDIFRQIFLKRSCFNTLRSSAIEAPLLSTSSSNRRDLVNNKGSFDCIRARLSEGFTGKSQTREVAFAALQHARLIDALSSPAAIRSRCVELVTSAPGFSEFCGHQRQIETGAYWSRGDIDNALALTPGAYQSWQREHNEAKHNDARQRALEALQAARKASVAYRSLNKAIAALRRLYGAPVKSWWIKSANADLLAELKELVAAGS